MANPWAKLIPTFALALFGCGDDSGGGGGGSATATGGGTGGAAQSTGGNLGECGWAGRDPGDLRAGGSAVGDVIANVQNLVDQCGARHSLWDFAGGYRIVVLAEGW